MIGANLFRVAKPASFTRGVGLESGWKLQHFNFQIRNSGGTLQCAFFDTSIGQLKAPAPEMVDRILWADNVWRTMPTVSSTLAFGNVGAGILSGGQFALFNTRLQNPFGDPQWPLFCSNAYHDTALSTMRVTMFAYLDFQTIRGLGSGYRPNLLMCNDFSSAFPSFNPANIPSGKQIGWNFTGFLS